MSQKKEETTNPNDARYKAIDMAIQQITKQFGEGSIMRLEESKVKKMDVIPTGAISLDIALGVGGVPKGRIIEVFGPESSGKTTLTLHIIAEAQKQGGVCAFVDAEHSFDPSYAKSLGIHTDQLLVSQPDYGEQALEIVETLVRSGGIDLVVVDSVAALTPKAEIDGEMGDSHMGLQARLMSQALRKLTGITGKTNTTVIFINQLRQKIGIMFGSPETTTGGNALKFYSSIRMDVRQKEKITDGDEVVGAITKVKIVKNKIAPPFREAMYESYYGKGIDKISSLIDAAVNFEVIEKSGAWFKFDGVNLGQGKDTVKNLLREDEKLLKQIWALVKEKSGI